MVRKHRLREKRRTFEFVDKSGQRVEDDRAPLAQERVERTHVRHEVGAGEQLVRVDAVPVDDSALGELLGREPREQVRELLVQLVLLAATQRRRVPDVRQLTRARLHHTHALYCRRYKIPSRMYSYLTLRLKIN